MSESSDATLRRLQDLLERRPDLEPIQILAHSSVAKSSFYMFLQQGRKLSERSENDIRRVLDLIERGDILQPDVAPVNITEIAAQPGAKVRRTRDFYVTETVRRIGQVLNYCADQSAIGCITGEYGIGKTEALQHWRSKDGLKIDHRVFEFDEFSARNVIDFIGCLADRLEVECDHSTRQGGQAMRAVCARLEKEPMLLILDQCEACCPRVLQVIRQIWDRTRHAGVGIVMLASPLLVNKLQAGRMKDVGALTSRIGIWAGLRGLQREEALNILRQEGISNIEDDAFALLWSAVHGSMRRLMAVVDLLTARHAGKAVTVRTIEGVAGNLWGLNLVGGKRQVAA